jgi:SAM-dependent methyltransferase
MDDATAEQLTSRQRMVWSAGDWPGFAPIIQNVSDEIVEAIGVGEGNAYLDIATGSGNAAEAAARRGARVTGLDLVPELIDAARARFASAGLEAEFVVGDAENLPFEDESFDRITSIFGVMFAPRHQVAANEMVRVARPGAAIAIAAWTPSGLNGQMFKLLSEHMPPPPEGFVPPVMCGDEDYVRSLFSASGLEVHCERRRANVQFESPDAWMEHVERNLGPVVMAKAALEPEGKWEPVRAELAELEESHNEADDGTIELSPEYLLTRVSVTGM